VGSLCLFLVVSPVGQNESLPWVVGLGFPLFLVAFIWGDRWSFARKTVAKINHRLDVLTRPPASITDPIAPPASADPQLKPSDDTLTHRLKQRTDSSPG
jgi:hypothetical protein